MIAQRKMKKAIATAAVLLVAASTLLRFQSWSDGVDYQYEGESSAWSRHLSIDLYERTATGLVEEGNERDTREFERLLRERLTKEPPGPERRDAIARLNKVQQSHLMKEEDARELLRGGDAATRPGGLNYESFLESMEKILSTAKERFYTGLMGTGSTGCKRLGLPQENIPLSPEAFEMDKGGTSNFIMVHEKYFYIAYPNEQWLMPHLDSSTGEFRTFNNARMHHRVRDVKPSDGIFIDVGGYVGDTALPSAAKNIDTYVFEPVRKNTNMIHFSILANDCHVSEHLTVVNALVGDKNSASESVYVSQRSDNAAATKDQATRNIGDSDTDYEQPVEMVMLDSFFPPGTKVANMKVDVQGFELQVLKGAERLLRENKGNLLLRFEFDSKLLKAAGTDPDELLNFVKSLGYEEVEREHSDMIMK